MGTSPVQAPLLTLFLTHLLSLFFLSVLLSAEVFNQSVNQRTACKRMKLNPIWDTQDNTAVKTITCLDNNPVACIKSPLPDFHSLSLSNLAVLMAKWMVVKSQLLSIASSFLFCFFPKLKSLCIIVSFRVIVVNKKSKSSHGIKSLSDQLKWDINHCTGKLKVISVRQKFRLKLVCLNL